MVAHVLQAFEVQWDVLVPFLSHAGSLLPHLQFVRLGSVQGVDI